MFDAGETMVCMMIVCLMIVCMMMFITISARDQRM